MENNVDKLHHLQSKTLMWKVFYLITAIAFVSGTGYLLYLLTFEWINDGKPLMFLKGNTVNFVLCVVLATVSWFFHELHAKTKEVLDKKVAEITKGQDR